jgi:hypothetical protein
MSADDAWNKNLLRRPQRELCQVIDIAVNLVEFAIEKTHGAWLPG